MLTLLEKVIFGLLVLGAGAAAARAADRIRRIIRRGHGPIKFDHAVERLTRAGVNFLTLAPTWRKIRWAPTLLHAFVAWAFIYYLLVNLGDVLQGMVGGFTFLGTGVIGGAYRLIADVLSVGALVGMVYLLARRFALRDPRLTWRPNTTLIERARRGIRRDSAIVGSFILVHVGSRFMGETFKVAEHGSDPWMPFASSVAQLWRGLPLGALVAMQHVFFWGALGTILIFIPYFLYSKHLHLFMAPINFLLRPERKSIGQLQAINFEDESITQYGAAKLEDLEWKLIEDAYACIMCNRCQDACPANATGKALSPAALEINKRYFINANNAALARGEPSPQGLLDFAIKPEEVWACTACGACIDICPVGNEPMRDILDIRRNLVLMETKFPASFQGAFRGMERQGNPWNVGPESRLEWAAGLNVPTVESNPEFEILYWVGCAPATDPRARKTARAFAQVLNAAGVNYAVLGRLERCTGDSARRSGNEFLFSQLAQQNTETLNEVLAPTPAAEAAAAASTATKRRIVATCPHCLHTLKNEYGDFGGQYEVVHHTELIAELTAAGKLKTDPAKQSNVAFHDPCYLGRHNGVFEAPRAALQAAGASVTELPRHGRQSFCCGAGGAQMWKEEEAGAQRVSDNRFAEAQATGQKTLAVGCPFCMIMLSDAANTAKSDMQVRDVAEIVLENLVQS